MLEADFTVKDEKNGHYFKLKLVCKTNIFIAHQIRCDKYVIYLNDIQIVM